MTFKLNISNLMLDIFNLKGGKMKKLIVGIVLTLVLIVGLWIFMTTEIFNKIDLLKDAEPHIERNDEGKPVSVWLTAQKAQGLELVQQAMSELLGLAMWDVELILPPQEGKLRAELYQLNGILDEKIDENGHFVLSVRISKIDQQRLNKQMGYGIEKWQSSH